jgi:thiol-disulfide isomerase/thioredoxin
MPMSRLFRTVILFLSLSLPVAVLAARADAQSVSPASVANAVLVSESGRSMRLADFRGKVVFVNFWGSWCTPCLQEMTSIRNLQAAFRGRNDIVFVFVSARSQELQKDGAWLREHGVTGETYRAEAGNPGLSVPTTFILDRTGAVAQFRNTVVDWELHADFVRNLLPAGSARS